MKRCHSFNAGTASLSINHFTWSLQIQSKRRCRDETLAVTTPTAIGRLGRPNFNRPTPLQTDFANGKRENQNEIV